MRYHLLYSKRALLPVCLLLALLGCQPSPATPSPSTPEPVSSPALEVTPTHWSTAPATPTPTQVPLAAQVNGEGITLAEFEAELARYQAALGGTELAPEDRQRVLEELIDQVLLAQATVQEGFVIEEEMLQARMESLSVQLGGAQALEAWMNQHGYDSASFRQALQRAISAAWMRDRIIASVPLTAEQVHARQILFYSRDQAEQVYALLQAGNSFDNLAWQYDPVTGGDLGWFPRGFLTDTRLEEVAFRLEVNAYSEVVQTSAGYHILQVLERDPNRPLEPDMLRIIQAQTLQAWLEARRQESDIQIFISLE